MIVFHICMSAQSPMKTMANCVAKGMICINLASRYWKDYCGIFHLETLKQRVKGMCLFLLNLSNLKEQNRKLVHRRS